MRAACTGTEQLVYGYRLLVPGIYCYANGWLFNTLPGEPDNHDLIIEAKMEVHEQPPSLLYASIILRVPYLKQFTLQPWYIT